MRLSKKKKKSMSHSWPNIKSVSLEDTEVPIPGTHEHWYTVRLRYLGGKEGLNLNTSTMEMHASQKYPSFVKSVKLNVISKNQKFPSQNPPSMRSV